jgi:hypothetical protein
MRNGILPKLPKRLDAMQLRWRVPLSGESPAGIAADGRYAAVADHAEGRDIYRCIDLATGRERWHRDRENHHDMDYGSAPRATPLFCNDFVFVLGAIGELLCLRLSDGELRWAKNLLTDFGPAVLPTWGYCNSPLIAEGRLIVNPGTPDAAVVTIAPQTGELLWAASGAAANYSSIIAGCFGGVSQVVGYDQKGLCGWAIDSGQLLWRLETGLGRGYIVPTPIEWEGKLIVSHEKGTYVHRFGAGGIVDSHPLAMTKQLSPSIGTPTRAGKWLLGHNNRRLIALSLNDDLKSKWTGPGDSRQKGFTHLVAQEDGNRAMAFFQSGWAMLLELSGAEPVVVEERQLTGETWSHPAVLDTAIICRDRQTLNCYEISEG